MSEHSNRVPPQVQSWLDLKTAAGHLGIGERNLRRLIAGGKIRYRQLSKGGCIHFRQEWLDEFNERHTVAPASPPRPTKAPRKCNAPPTPPGDWWRFTQTASQRGSA